MSERLRLIHVASGDLWAGAETQTYNLVRRLSGRRLADLCVVLLNHGELEVRLARDGISVFVIDESLHGTVTILAKLLQLVRRFRPHLIHTHRAKEHLLGATAAALVPGVRSLRTVHGMPETMITSRQLAIRSRMIMALDQFVATRMQVCSIAVSDDLANTLSRTLGRANVVSIPNGIDVDETNRAADAPPPLPNDGRMGIGCIGRLVSVKRIDVFLQAARIIASAHPNTYRFYVVGEGPMRGSLEEHARRLGLGDNCVFTGFLPEPLPLLRRLRALVLTSDHEGTPMVALEALALGVPVVAHAVGGLVSLLDTEGLGHLVQSQDPQLIAKAILSVAPPGSVAPRGDSLLPQRYTIDACADAHMALYENLRRERTGRTVRGLHHPGTP